MIGFVTRQFYNNDGAKRWPSDKANHSCENMLYKLLYVIQVVNRIFDK